LGEEMLTSSDPETKIEQMLRKIADMQVSSGNAGQMPVLLQSLKENLEDLLACLPMTKAVEAVPTAIVLTDLFGNIEYVNPSLLKISGFRDISEAKGRSVFDFTNAEGKNKLQEEVIPALHSIGQWQGELFLKRSDGQSYMAEMICALVKDDSGNPIHLLANFYNITDRKRAEEALLLDDSRLEALQRLNQMDEATIKEIADYALDAGVKLTGSELGYLAFVDDEEKTLFMHS